MTLKSSAIAKADMINKQGNSQYSLQAQAETTTLYDSRDGGCHCRETVTDPHQLSSAR